MAWVAVPRLGDDKLGEFVQPFFSGHVGPGFAAFFERRVEIFQFCFGLGLVDGLL